MMKKKGGEMKEFFHADYALPSSSTNPARDDMRIEKISMIENECQRHGMYRFLILFLITTSQLSLIFLVFTFHNSNF